MKKPLCALLCLSLLAAPALQALDLADFGNIDAIMEDNAFTDAVNRYSAVQLSYFPEFATRIGFESADNKLDRRDTERDAQALRALHIVKENLREVNRKNLSEPKKTDYDVLQGRLAMSVYDAERNRPALDPLLYAQAFDALYDLNLKTINYQDLQDRDIAARLNALPQVAQQAQKNLTTPPAFLAQLAMESAYYAYLAFDDIPQYLFTRAQDDVSRAQVRADARASKKAVKEMFELFKKLAQENREQDFRLGDKTYEFVLQNRYFISEKGRAMEKRLSKNFQTAQTNLAKALEAFALPAAVQQTEEIMQNIQVPGEEASEDGVTVSPIEEQPAEQTANKKNKNAPSVTAADFYAVAKRLTEGVKNRDFVAALNKEASNLTKFFAQDGALPSSDVKFTVREMPAYYAYTRPYFFMPPFGTQTNPTHDLFVRLPSGNEITKQEMLNADFNLPVLKLLMAGQLVPGLAYRSAYAGQSLSSFRKMYPVPTLRNGWEVYAQHLANERGYIITDEEQLFLAWADYVRAAQALADFYLHTNRFTYAQAYAWLTEENAFDKTQAETLLKQTALLPGEAVSYIYGYDALKNLRAKYQKKQGKKFDLGDFHGKVISLGNIPPERLETEMEHAYQLEKTRLTQSLNTPFYLN